MKATHDYSSTSKIDSIVILGVLFGIIGAATVSAKPTHSPPVIKPQQTLLFEKNMGQFDETADFVAHGRGYSIILGQQPVIELYRFTPGPEQPEFDADEAPRVSMRLRSAARIRIKIPGAQADAVAIPLEKQRKLTHYLAGEPKDWRTDVPNFKRIRYSELLPGIDVEYYGRDGRLEYDFVVRPGADPSAIKLEFEGTGGIAVDEFGNLVINLGGEKIVQRAPVSYQIGEDGERVEIASAYVVQEGGVSFELAAWDHDKTLVIDPVLEYSRYYGGARTDYPVALDLDAAGNIYVVGYSSSPDMASSGAYMENGGARQEVLSFPFCADCIDEIFPGGQVERTHITRSSKILVTKFSPDAQEIIWSTYFDTISEYDVIDINSAAVSDSGEVAFGLQTASAGLPLVNETQAFADNQYNAYVAKLNPAGNALVFATYLALGPEGFYLRGLDVSADGKVAVSGILSYDNTFPVVTGITGQSCLLDADSYELDGYVALFNTSGTLTFSSCLGGQTESLFSIEGLRGVAIGNTGDLFVVGYSNSSDFPVVNPVQATRNSTSSREMTISQIDPETGSLVFSTWFSPASAGSIPSGYDYDVPRYAPNFFPYDIKTDSQNNILVTGLINSLSYPTVNAAQGNMAAPRNSFDFLDWTGKSISQPSDIFLTKIDPENGVVFSTYLGGSRAEGTVSLSVDNLDNVYISGSTQSDDFPLLNAISATNSSGNALVVSKLTPAGAIAFSSYLGVARPGYPSGVAINASGQIIAAGATNSDDFVVVGSDTSRAGAYDITLMIIDQSADTDTDGDGVPDAVDAFPEDDSEWRDTDGDLTGDNADIDDDGDGKPDDSDRFPLDNAETADADEDGAGNNRDEFDADIANYFDYDDDGLADFDGAETDIDADGAENAVDAFDFDATETIDSDGDGLGDNADGDDDGDLTPDVEDVAPLDFDIPTYTFERYNAWDTNLFKSPWPVGFLDVEGADAAWTSADDQSHSGDISFSSRAIDHLQTAAIQHSETYPRGTVQFWYKVDSEETFDVFTFSVDSTVLLTDSGDTGWKMFSSPISAGDHALEWRYTKDSNLSIGDDAAWIDDFVIIADTSETCNVNTIAGITQNAQATYEACEILVVGPSFIAEAGANITLSSGWEIDFMPGFTVEQGATLDAAVCGQSLCLSSPDPMPYGCHSCVDQICDIEPSCCGVAFDQACVDKVASICGLVCE